MDIGTKVAHTQVVSTSSEPLLMRRASASDIAADMASEQSPQQGLDRSTAGATDSKPTKEVTARLRLLEGLLASSPVPSSPTPRQQQKHERQQQVVRVMEWLVGALGIGALGGVGLLAVRAWTAVTPAPAGVMTLLALSALLALIASALALGSGRWDALLLRLFRRSVREISVRDRWMTLIGALLLLGGAVAQMGAAASVLTESDSKTTEIR